MIQKFKKASSDFDRHLAQKGSIYRTGPAHQQHRQVRDILCCILFILGIIALISVGIWSYVKGNQSLQTLKTKYQIDLNFSKQSGQNLQQIDRNIFNFDKYINLNGSQPILVGITVGMIPLTGASCYVFVLIMRAYAGCVIWFALIFSLISTLVAGIVMLFFPPTLVIGIISLVSFVLMLTFLICSRDKIRVAIILARVAAIHLLQEVKLIIILIITAFLFMVTLAFFIGMVVLLIAMFINDDLPQQNFGILTAYLVFQTTWVFCYFSFFISFVSGFTFGQKFWNQQITYCKSIKFFFLYSSGSAAFGGAIVAVIRLINFLIDTDQKQDDGCCKCLCYCLKACLQYIAFIVKILSSYAMYMSAMTGFNYWQSGKSICRFLIDNFSFFGIIETITHGIILFASMACSAIPTLIGFLLLRQKEINLLFTLVVFFASLGTSYIMISGYVDTISAGFLFLIFNKHLQEMGEHSKHPNQINQAFTEAFPKLHNNEKYMTSPQNQKL